MMFRVGRADFEVDVQCLNSLLPSAHRGRKSKPNHGGTPRPPHWHLAGCLSATTSRPNNRIVHLSLTTQYSSKSDVSHLASLALFLVWALNHVQPRSLPLSSQPSIFPQLSIFLAGIIERAATAARCRYGGHREAETEGTKSRSRPSSKGD